MATRGYKSICIDLACRLELELWIPTSSHMSVPCFSFSTQGTVVEWMVSPGQAVQPDDVVAMVETDKVTIEIKADISGVVTRHFSEV